MIKYLSLTLMIHLIHLTSNDKPLKNSSNRMKWLFCDRGKEKIAQFKQMSRVTFEFIFVSSLKLVHLWTKLEESTKINLKQRRDIFWLSSFLFSSVTKQSWIHLRFFFNGCNVSRWLLTIAIMLYYTWSYQFLVLSKIKIKDFFWLSF